MTSTAHAFRGHHQRVQVDFGDLEVLGQPGDPEEDVFEGPDIQASLSTVRRIGGPKVTSWGGEPSKA